MLYPENEKPLTKELFQNPGSAYRGTPFWAWNAELDAEKLKWQIEHFKKMGLGGFHMHVRTGMATPYMSDAFMDLIKTCVDKAKDLDMLAWLYDEDRWPSGAAGGLVTRHEPYRARHLLFTAQPYDRSKPSDYVPDSSAKTSRTGNGRLLACYDILLYANGTLKSYQRIEPARPAAGKKWYAYLETALPSPWYNNQTYVDTLNPKAIADFIDKTHRLYAEKVGDDFGGVIPAIFTDEPQFTHKTTLLHAQQETDLVMPWTDSLSETFMEEWSFDILDALPELVWELPEGQLSKARYAYHDHIAERFSSAFADQCGAWCREHGLMLTGHMMEEPTLASQTAALGEAMRSYRGFDLPGIDILCNRYEYTTAKQAQSAARQHGNPGVLSELYGVTNWDFDFRGHKAQGDWQAALGVTVRVHHLSWYAMAGEAKRDYPASIHYQSSWSERYPVIEDHFARVNTAMTRGKPVCKTAVLHPIESFWLCWGPVDQTAAARDQLDAQFSQLSEWLLFGQIDYDYICESLLPDQCPQGSSPLRVGDMAYESIIIPDILTLRGSTLERLAAFQEQGGTVICLGEAPAYIDGRPTGAKEAGKIAQLYDQALKLPFNQTSLLQALEPVRDLDLFHESGRRADQLLYQMRADGDCRWLFIAKGRDPGKADQPGAWPLEIKVRGHWRPEFYNTLTGETQTVTATLTADSTTISWPLYDHDSLLFCLRPASPGQLTQSGPLNQIANLEQNLQLQALDVFSHQVPIVLNEPNVLLLDNAAWKLGDSAWQPADEILRLDNKIRKELGWPTREDKIAQPWTVSDEPFKHQVSLKFTISCETSVSQPKLALEDAKRAAVRLDGQKVQAGVDGWYVDQTIETISLPDLVPGEHVLEITWPFNQRSNLEWCYLLGDFSVDVQGSRCVVKPPVREVSFSDLTHQGFPFYGGAVRYQLNVEAKGGQIQVHVPFYRGTMLDVYLDSTLCGPAVFSPYTQTISGVADGKHLLELVLYASRVNSFGCVHNCVRDYSWFGPDGWRTEGDAFAYEYQLKELGILKAPVVRCLSTLPG